jgi:class 3 adenylate cyclase/tetratricopeptide (TPR) repeat protein
MIGDDRNAIGIGEVRKTVTVLFADVTGSTELGERLDPESLRQVMTRYFAVMRSALERHGGTVEKFIGDAVMAVFGIPRLHEDDALRAVRAAADMQQELAALNGELERDWGVTISIRIGVNTGEVVADTSSPGGSLITGDAVNVAARLEQAADNGEVLIGEATYALVKDAVVAKETEPLSLRGKAERVPGYRLLEVHATEPILRHFDSTMVGRLRERALLRQALDRAEADRMCHLFTVMGAAGVGKSRLVEELIKEVDPRVRILNGRCLPYGQGITFGAVRDIVREIAQIEIGDTSDQARSKISSALREEDRGELIADRVSQLMGLSESAIPTEESFWAIRKLLEALSRERPLLIVFEDIHWAEPTFLDLVEHVADWARDAPILLICLARTELLDLRRSWGGGKLNATTIQLEPLTDAESGELIENLLGPEAVRGSTRSRIAEAAEGNPLFLEETLSMMIDVGLFRRDDGRWVLAGDLSTLSVPPSIQALLAARLDRLQPEERVVIERASVVGRVFSLDAVRALTADDEADELETALQALVKKELIRPERVQTLRGEGFRFRHLLIREAAYQSMPKQTRAIMHERFAAWLEDARETRVSGFEELIGYHLEQAYRYRSELGPPSEGDHALRLSAAARLAVAGQQALGREDMPAAVNLLTRATDLMDRNPERLVLLPDLATALAETSEFAAAEALLDETVREATEGDYAGVQAHALLARLLVHVQTSPQELTEQAIGEAERAARIFEEADDVRGLAKAWRVIGEVHWMRCHFADADQAFARSLGFARTAGDQRQEAWGLYLLAAGAAWGPMPVPEGIARCEEIMGHAGGNPIVEARALLSLGTLTAMRGSFDEARTLIARGRAVLGDVGLKKWTAASCQTAAYIEMLAGDAPAAEHELRTGYGVLDQMGEKSYLSTFAAELAQALYRQSRLHECERFTRVSEEIAAPDDLAAQVTWRGPRAKVLARRGELDPAQQLAEEAVALAETTDYLDLRGDAHMDRAEVQGLAGDLTAAASSAAMALGLYERKGNVVSAGRARDFKAGVV